MKFRETESRVVVARGWGTREQWELFNEFRVLVREDENVLEMDGSDC